MTGRIALQTKALQTAQEETNRRLLIVFRRISIELKHDVNNGRIHPEKTQVM